MDAYYKKFIVVLFLIIANICFLQGLKHEDTMRFFDVGNIENSQSRICLEKNITQLLDKQLSLTSGQHLWEAFCIWIKRAKRNLLLNLPLK